MKLTNLSKIDFKKILEDYDIGKYKDHQHIFAAGNTIYKLKTTKGKYVLKIYENSNLGFIKFQINLISYLCSKGVSTPRIISTKNKEKLFLYMNKKITIQEFVDGKKVLYVNKKLAIDMGKKIGILSNALTKFGKKTRAKWAKDYHKELIKWKIDNLNGTDLAKESKELLTEIKTIKFNKLRKSMIHGDICEGNFLVDKDHVSSFLDWDDCHEDFLINEIAVPISHNFVTRKKANKKLIEIFLKEYQKYIKLNDEEKKALYSFIKYRQLSSTSWCIDQAIKHWDRKKEIMGWADFCLKRYKSFSKLTLDEFLELAR